MMAQECTLERTTARSDRNRSDARPNTGLIALRDLCFRWCAYLDPVLVIPELSIGIGEHIFIQGPSGSGKTTLLSLLAGVIKAQQGSVTVLGRRIDQLGSAARDRFRADHIGFIFQMFNLLPYLSVVENVILPCRFSRRRVERLQAWGRTPGAEALRLLQQLNLSNPELLERPVTELSVGQQQRVAAARALIGSPEILIADEPTSALDTANQGAFIDLLFEECKASGATLLFVSHDDSLASRFERTVKIQDPGFRSREGGSYRESCISHSESQRNPEFCHVNPAFHRKEVIE